MPVATEFVNYSLNKGTDILEGVKGGKGVVTAPIRLALKVAEGPVVYVLDSSLGKAGVSVAGRCVKLADGTVDGAVNSSVVKTTGRMYTDTTTAVSTRVTQTSDKISSVYQGSLSSADDYVERFLPGDDKELPITPRVLVKKITRRGVKRVRAVPSNLRKMAARTKDSVSTTLSTTLDQVQFSISEQPLGRNVKRFRGGLVFKAHRLLYHSTLGSRVIKKNPRPGPPRQRAQEHGRRLHARHQER